MALRQVLHQVGHAESPRCDLVTVVHAVNQRAQLPGADTDDVPDPVSEALAPLVTILGRRELGAEEKHHPVRVLVRAVDRLRDKFGEQSISLASGLKGTFRERTHEAMPMKERPDSEKE